VQNQEQSLGPTGPTIGSCFAGIDGFGLGFTRAGFDLRWQIEIDPWCRRVLAHHWPQVHRHADVRTAGAHNLEYVDVLTGGWPCQPVSQASRGRRLGTSDDRWLWPEMRRLIAELRPRWVVGENVSHLDRGELDTVVSDLEALDYEVGPVLEIPACALGHDHRRSRLWICGHTDRHGESRLPLDAEASGVSGSGDDAGGVGAPHGIPGGLYRRRMTALGNALVPQIAEMLAVAIRGAMQNQQEAAA
jgi:DNA (cytosine-5)-methyltransferase 1